MRIVPPSPAINLYKDGFEKFDLLNRSAQGKQLSDLVERIEDPLVIAIDGQWGSGKSFFLKCWVGAHTNENGGTAQTVYFDAFEHDFLDNPLLSLTSAIAMRLPESTAAQRAWEKAKKAVAVLWRPATRIALAATTAGISEGLGTAAKAAADASHGELTDHVNMLWQREASQRAAMANFREALIALTKANGDGDKPRKLVVTIDELDRCRPDYALSALEIIKHFFNVPHVHFVLGINLHELENIVHIRYGEKTNSRLYLQKFIILTIHLSDIFYNNHLSRPVSLEYFNKIALKMEINKQIIEDVEDYLERPTVTRSLTLRSAERLLTQMALIPQIDSPYERIYLGYRIIISGLIIIKSLYPDLYKKFNRELITIQDIYDLFSINKPIDRKNDRVGYIIHQVWAAFYDSSAVDDMQNLSTIFGGFGPDLTKQTFFNIKKKYLDSISPGTREN